MIKVLWVNNGKDELLSFLSNANERGIEIHTCKSMIECRAHLTNNNGERWDAVILNCDARLEMETPKRDNFGEAMAQMKDYNKLSCFIVCETELDIIEKTKIKCWASERGDKDIYNLETDVSSLYDDIITEVKNLPDYFVRKKYKNELELCDYRQELVDILVKYESDLEGLKSDYNIPNNCRKLFEFLTNSDLFVELYEVLDEGEFFKQENHKFAPALVSAVLGKNDNNVPSYIKRSIHFCTEVCNDGSHELNGSGVNTLIQNGDAPYLNMSLVANLLNVLHWLNLHKEKGDLNDLMIKAGENYLNNQNTKR